MGCGSNLMGVDSFGKTHTTAGRSRADGCDVAQDAQDVDRFCEIDRQGSGRLQGYPWVVSLAFLSTFILLTSFFFQPRTKTTD